MDNMVHVDVSLFDALPPAAELAAEDEICSQFANFCNILGNCLGCSSHFFAFSFSMVCGTPKLKATNEYCTHRWRSHVSP